MKKILSILFALLAVATGAQAETYGLYVCGEQVTDANKNSLSSLPGVERGTITFDGTTLTLNNVLIDLSGESKNGITLSQSGMTLKLLGENRLISDYAALCVGRTATIEGPGKLEAWSKLYGLLMRNDDTSSKSLTIHKGARIDATGGEYGIYDNSQKYAVYIRDAETEVEALGYNQGSFCNASSITLRLGCQLLKPSGAKISNGSICYASGSVVVGEKVRIAAPVGIPINENNFPDAVFRKYVKDNFDDGDSYLTDEEIAAVKVIDVSIAYEDFHSTQITSLQGVELFTALETLSCRSNALTSLDVSHMPALTYLDCSSNKIESIDLTHNPALNFLRCSWNNLSAIDLSHNEALTYVDVSVNDLTTIDLSHNEALTYLDCSSNNFMTNPLDLSHNPLLSTLYCEANGMQKLDLSHNPLLTELICQENLLFNLDVSNLTALTKLVCNDNFLKTLDLSGNPDLTLLCCSCNFIKGTLMTAMIKSLPMRPQNDGELEAIMLSDGEEYRSNAMSKSQAAMALTKGWTPKYFDWSNVSARWQDYEGSDVEINDKNFPDNNFRAYVAENLDQDGNGWLTDQEIEAVSRIRVDNKLIENLSGIEFFSELKYLTCSNNRLTYLDMDYNPKLQQLVCVGNQLYDIQLTNNPQLYTLDCSQNQLAQIDLSKNTELNSLSVSNNPLTSLNVANNALLTALDCSYTSLTSIDVSNNPELDYLHCQNSSINTIIATNNAKLTNLTANDNQLSSLDLSKLTGLRYCDCYNNQLETLDFTHNANLISSNCANNQLTSILLGNNSMLRLLTFYNNKVMVEQMDALVASLPTRANNDGRLEAISPSSKTEQNVITAAQVRAAQAKGWTVYADGKPYAGYRPDIAIDETNFPDWNFRYFVKNNLQPDGNNWLSPSEIDEVTEIYAVDMNISDLKGVEFFTELKELSVDQNQISELDLSQNTKLERLACGYNQLSALDLSHNRMLMMLFCSNNQLTSLDVSSCPHLFYLYCSGNRINATEMGKLVESMPMVVRSVDNELQPGYFQPYDFTVEEHNVITTAQVAQAKAKNWKVQAWTNSGLVDYEGVSVATGISTPLSRPASSFVSGDLPSPYYSLDGQRVSGKPTKKGVYVKDGRKVVVK